MKSFIFDLYNTLIDVRTDEHREQTWAPVVAALRKSKIKTDWEKVCELYDVLWEKQLTELVAKGEFTYPEGDGVLVMQDVTEALGKRVSVGEATKLLRIMRKASVVWLRPFEGTAGLLSQLRAGGAGIYLLSNAQASFTYDEIRACGLLDLFDGVLLSSEQGVRKPDTAYFDMLFDMYGLDKSTAVMVGDDPESDGKGARDYGIAYIETKGGAAAHAAELLAALGK